MFDDLIKDKDGQSWVCSGCGMVWDTDIKRCAICNTAAPFEIDLNKREVGQLK